MLTSLLYFLDSTFKCYHTLFVFLWLISLSLPSPSMLLLFHDRVIRICVCVCVHHIFIHSSSMDTGYFHILANVNNAKMNIGVLVSFEFVLLWDIYTQEWNCWIIFLVFLERSILFSTVFAAIYIPTKVCEGSLFPTSSPAFVICSRFDNGRSDRCGKYLTVVLICMRGKCFR